MVELMQDENQGDETAEMRRQAYNAAFEELGLSWHWDIVTYACLPSQDRRGLRAYLEQEQSHMLRAYEADFLVEAIETAKERCLAVMTRNRSQVPGYMAQQQVARTPHFA